MEWASIILQHCAIEEEVWNAYGLDVVLHDTHMLDALLSSGARNSVKTSAILVTRRALRKLCGVVPYGSSAVRAIVAKLTAKSQALGVRSAVFLGILAGVCTRVPTGRTALQDVKDLYYSFYIREILGSRTPVSAYIVAIFNDFFANFTTVDDLRKDVVPALEKALLRAPEVVLNDLVSPMIKSLPSEIDLSDFLAGHLLKPLLTNIKSQVPMIRNGAMSAFATCISSCHMESELQKITDDILGPLTSSKLPGSEQRAIHARMLSLLPYDSKRTMNICSGLATVSTREANESALSAEAIAFASCLSSILISATDSGLDTLPTPVVEAVSKGLSDKRPAFKKIWTMVIGDIIWTLRSRSKDSAPVLQLVEVVEPKLLDFFNEIISNPLPSAQSGTVAAAYAIIAIQAYLRDATRSVTVKTSIEKARLFERAFSSDLKASLLNPRIYTRLHEDGEVLWVSRALQAYADVALESDSSSKASNAWAQAFLYIITASDISPTAKTQAAAALSAVYMSNPGPVANSIIDGLWVWYTHVEHLEKDTAAAASKSGTAKLYFAVRSILPITETQLKILNSEILHDELVNFLVLARPEILPRVDWIQICLQVRKDPGDLVRAKSVECLSHLNQKLQPRGARDSVINIAVYKAAAELAFVAPEVMTPILVREIQSKLDADTTRKFGVTEVAIAHTPEGTTFIDVLSGKGPKSIDRNARDYDTMKWEEEIRAQLSQKKGQEKKLTADERAKGTTQLEKEARIRQEVLHLEQNMRHGIGFIEALATGPPTEAEVWMRPCLQALLAVITAGAGRFVNNDANEAYLACSSLVSMRLGTLRRFIGIATLRGLESTHLSEPFLQEPLGGMRV